MAEEREVQIMVRERVVIITPPRLSLKQMLMPTRSSTASCLVLPTDSAAFNFKSGVINLLPTFHGLERENPYTHILGSSRTYVPHV